MFASSWIDQCNPVSGKTNCIRAHLKTVESGFVVMPATPLGPIDDSPGIGWNRQGHPFYGGGVAYSEKFDVTGDVSKITAFQLVWASWSPGRRVRSTLRSTRRRRKPQKLEENHDDAC